MERSSSSALQGSTWLLALAALTLGIATAPPAAAQFAKECSNGDTRCAADGYVQYCVGEKWFNNDNLGRRVRCEGAVTTMQEQRLCSVGEQRCGPSGTVLQCEAGFGNSDPKWRDTYKRCQ